MRTVAKSSGLIRCGFGLLLASCAAGGGTPSGHSGSPEAGAGAPDAPAGTVPCATTLDCPGKLVCDAANGTCVECVTDAECGSGAACIAQTCRAVVACTSDLDCKAMGQLCDPGLRRCVECVNDAGCPGGICKQGLCAPIVCTAGQKACDGPDAIGTCSADGTKLDPAPCAAGTTCGGPPGDPICLHAPPPPPDPNGVLSIVVSGWVRTPTGIVELNSAPELDRVISQCAPARSFSIRACPQGDCLLSAPGSVAWDWNHVGGRPTPGRWSGTPDWLLSFQGPTRCDVGGDAQLGAYELDWSGDDFSPAGHLHGVATVTTINCVTAPGTAMPETPMAADLHVELAGHCP